MAGLSKGEVLILHEDTKVVVLLRSYGGYERHDKCLLNPMDEHLAAGCSLAPAWTTHHDL